MWSCALSKWFITFFLSLNQHQYPRINVSVPPLNLRDFFVMIYSSSVLYPSFCMYMTVSSLCKLIYELAIYICIFDSFSAYGILKDPICARNRYMIFGWCKWWVMQMSWLVVDNSSMDLCRICNGKTYLNENVETLVVDYWLSYMHITV